MSLLGLDILISRAVGGLPSPCAWTTPTTYPAVTTALRFGLIEELHKAGSMVFIVAARRAGRWHLLEVGSVYP